jgi:hypothetical protein
MAHRLPEGKGDENQEGDEGETTPVDADILLALFCGEFLR